MQKFHNSLNQEYSCTLVSVSYRFKEELIQELVKNSRAVQCMNTAYQTKIATLEREATMTREQLKKVYHQYKRERERM